MLVGRIKTLDRYVYLNISIKVQQTVTMDMHSLRRHETQLSPLETDSPRPFCVQGGCGRGCRPQVQVSF